MTVKLAAKSWSLIFENAVHFRENSWVLLQLCHLENPLWNTFPTYLSHPNHHKFTIRLSFTVIQADWRFLQNSPSSKPVSKISIGLFFFVAPAACDMQVISFYALIVKYSVLRCYDKSFCYKGQSGKDVRRH